MSLPRAVVVGGLFTVCLTAGMTSAPPPAEAGCVRLCPVKTVPVRVCKKFLGLVKVKCWREMREKKLPCRLSC